MTSRSHRLLTQMGIVAAFAAVASITILALKFESVVNWALEDYRPLLLNGIILILFTLGTWQLFRAVRHYQAQENLIADFIRARQDGLNTDAAFSALPAQGLLADRYHTIRELFQKSGPIDHGAISAIMMAEESMHQSFPRFVNNVLILTGVFGTVSSLILALVGAGDVLQTNSADSGMGLLLLGMNTALTTTATAIVCYFFFTFFFHRLTDLQTWVFSRLERACLLYILPEFTSEPDAVNHQTKLLLEEIRVMVQEMRQHFGLDDDPIFLSRSHADQPEDHGPALLAALEKQNQALAASQSRLDQLQRTLVDGFRLDR